VAVKFSLALPESLKAPVRVTPPPPKVPPLT
jgi:hypothetical protein